MRRRVAALYLRPRLIAVLFLGFVSGLPLALVLGTLSVWLTEAGLSLKAIGLFAAVGTPYTLKFLWAPVIDRLPLPFMTRIFGRRRGWLLAVQAVLMLSIIGLGVSRPAVDPYFTALMALMVAFWSATQDIVIDAYRVELLTLEEQAAGAAMVVFGYRVGLLVAGAGALLLATYLSWPVVYAVMAGFVLVGALTVLLSPEPVDGKIENGAAGDGKSRGKAGLWFYQAVVMPFGDFAARPGWAYILIFVMLYKLGDQVAGVMLNPFFILIGFSKAEIASVAKLFGFTATIGGLALGGMLMAATGLYRALLICALLQCFSILLFAAQAMMGADLGFLALTVGVENLASGMGTAVFVAYLSSLCSRAFTATQYALLSSLAAVARNWLSSGAGFMADRLGWAGFFLFSAALALPGLIMLVWLRRKLIENPDLNLVGQKAAGVEKAGQPPA
jgi:PAT family beta-lactamase induction signal transducer AmpG